MKVNSEAIVKIKMNVDEAREVHWALNYAINHMVNNKSRTIVQKLIDRLDTLGAGSE